MFFTSHDPGGTWPRRAGAFWLVRDKGLYGTKAGQIHGLAGSRVLGKSILPVWQTYPTVNCIFSMLVLAGDRQKRGRAAHVQEEKARGLRCYTQWYEEHVGVVANIACNHVT